MKSCCVCELPSVTENLYSGLSLCKEHFNEHIEKKVIDNIKKTNMVKGNESVFVAASGGKDSSATLYILNKLKTPLNFDLHAITINLGIQAHSPLAVELVQNFCKKIGVPNVVISFHDFYGVTIDDIAKNPNNKERCCVYCSELRKFLIEIKSKELGADKLALGYTLDDMFLVILNSVIRSDLLKSAQYISPVFPSDMLAKRFGYTYPRQIMPLNVLSEKEIKFYCEINDIPVVPHTCSYSAPTEKKTQGSWRSLLNSIMDQLIQYNQDVCLSTLENYCKNYLAYLDNSSSLDIKFTCSICKNKAVIAKSALRQGQICTDCLNNAGITLDMSKY